MMINIPTNIEIQEQAVSIDKDTIYVTMDLAIIKSRDIIAKKLTDMCHNPDSECIFCDGTKIYCPFKLNNTDIRICELVKEDWWSKALAQEYLMNKELMIDILANAGIAIGMVIISIIAMLNF